ncbi:MAG: hypothetical protein ABIJ15_04640 [bacterium]
MPAENDNLRGLKIALGQQVTSIHKKYEEDISRLKDKIQQIEKDRAYLQAKSSIATAKINREYRSRLLELDHREKEIVQKQYVLDVREQKLNKQLEEKDGIIRTLNVQAMETETNLTSEFNQKLRTKEWEILRLSDEIKALNRILKDKDKESQSKADALTGEIRQSRETGKKEILSLSSQFAVERGEFERERFTLQQNIKALKNTITAIKESQRKSSAEYEDRFKAKTLTDAEEMSNLQNRISELELEKDSLQKNFEDVRLRMGLQLQETEKKDQKQIQNLTSEVQSGRQEIALLEKGSKELRSINETAKDNYNQKISDIEETSRAVEIELRNRIMEKESDIERLEKAQKVLEEKFSVKLSEAGKENLSLQKELEEERNKKRELENKHAAEYLAQTSEKKHLQEIYEKEIVSLKERILTRATAMSTLEGAFSREKTNLKIKISGLLDDIAVLKEQTQDLRKESDEISKEKDGRIHSLDLLIKEREKEASDRFSEISEKYKILALERQNGIENYEKELGEKEEKLSRVLQEIETVKLNGSIALSSAEKEKEQQAAALRSRIEVLEENLKNTMENMQEEREKHLLLLKDKERQYEADRSEAQKEIASRDDLLFRSHDENRRKLLEKDQKYSVEIDNLRRTILQNSGEYQKEKEGLNGKIRELQSRINEEENVHKKEITGLNALRVSEKDSLRNTAAQLNGEIARLKEELEKGKKEISALTASAAADKGRIEALAGEKINISQSLNALLSEKQDAMEKLTAQIDTLKSNFFDTLKHKEAENRRLTEEINGLKEVKTVDEEKLKNIRAAFEQENKALGEEISNLKNRSAAQKAEFEKKVEVLVIEKASGMDNLKTIISTLKQEMQQLQSGNRLTSENLKKHYLEMIAEKDSAFTREVDSYEVKIGELNGTISKLSAETEKMNERFREVLVNFEKERTKLEQGTVKAVNAVKTQAEKREEELMQAVSQLQEKIDARQNEASAKQEAVSVETEQLRRQLSEWRVSRETEFGKWNEQRRELENQLKIQDMRRKEEIKRSGKSITSAESAIAALNEQLQKTDAEWKRKNIAQDETHKREIAAMQEQAGKMKDEISRIYKSGADDKQASGEDFANRMREQDNKFNTERMQLMNELRDLRDINRALEEELSGIRSRLESAKKGV